MHIIIDIRGHIHVALAPFIVNSWFLCVGFFTTTSMQSPFCVSDYQSIVLKTYRIAHPCTSIHQRFFCQTSYGPYLSKFFTANVYLLYGNEIIRDLIINYYVNRLRGGQVG